MDQSFSSRSRGTHRSSNWWRRTATDRWGCKSLNGQQRSLFIWVYKFSMLISIVQKSIRVPTVGQQGKKYDMNADVYGQRKEIHNIHTFSNINTWGTECAKSHATAATRILPVCPQFVSLNICCCCVYMVKTLGGLLLFYFKIMYGFSNIYCSMNITLLLSKCTSV